MTQDSESDRIHLWTRRDVLETGGAGAATTAAYPLSHGGGESGGFLSSIFSSDADFVVTHNDEVVSEDPNELNFQGSAIKEVTVPNDYDDVVRITLEGGSGSGGAFVDTDDDGVAELQDDHVDFQGGDARKVGSVGVDELVGGYVGDVRAVSNGEVVASIDPAGTTTPVSDARDAIVNQGNGSGVILYPPTTITEESAYTQTRIGISHKGYGVDSSKVVFPSGTTDGYVWDGISRVEFDGITVSGGDGTRTAGSAWRFATAPTDDFNVGVVQFQDWAGSDPIVHFDTGHAYSSDWQKLRIDTSNEGTAFAFHDSFGPGLSINNVRCSLGTADACFDLTDGAGGFVTDIGLSVQALNIGGSTTHAVLARNSNGQVHFGEITWFGSGTTAIVEVPQGRVPNVEMIRAAGGATIDALYRLGNAGGCQAGHLADAADDANVTLNVGPVEVQSDITAQATIYEGRSAQVTDNSGLTLTRGVSCLGDQTIVT